MINRKATIRWKGYDPANLKPQSSKRVWANCDVCGHGRWVVYQSYRDLCYKCAKMAMRGIKMSVEACKKMSESRIEYIRLQKLEFVCEDVCEEDRFIPGTDIDRIITIEKLGYDPIYLKPKSGKKVWCICGKCNIGRFVIMSNWHKNSLCLYCHSHEQSPGSLGKQDYTAKYDNVVDKENRIEALTNVNRDETYRLFGYYPEDLKPNSMFKIVAICPMCGGNRETTLNNWESEQYCRGCAQINRENNLTSEEKYIRSRKMSARLQGILYDEWEGFAVGQEYCPKFDEECRESNREKYDRQCFLCGEDEGKNGKKLSVHHVDMNKRQGCDGHKWKLIPLCMVCHGKSHSKIWESRIEWLLDNNGCGI